MSTSAEGASPAGSPPPAHTDAPAYTPDDRVAPEDHSLLWPDAHLLAAPPPDYEPLEMPEVWEPDAAPAAPPQPWPYAPYAPTRQQPPEPEPTPAAGPVPGYVISVPYEGSPAPAATPRAPAGPATPRSFRDLRTGPLAGRDFGSMQEFAVAAVLEAGYAQADVARLFRFAPWQLRAWVDEARNASFGPGPNPA